MQSLRVIRIAAAAALGFCSHAAVAHVTLETRQAPAGSYYKAVIRVPHGCDGTPTTTVRVRIADGVTSVKPQPKPGWKLAIIKGKLAMPYADSHGNQITEAVREVAWSGGHLLDEHYDEFVMQMRLPETPNATLYFPVVQECVKGAHRWIEIPAAGKAPGDYKQPAPALGLVPRPK